MRHWYRLWTNKHNKCTPGDHNLFGISFNEGYGVVGDVILCRKSSAAVGREHWTQRFLVRKKGYSKGRAQADAFRRSREKNGGDEARKIGRSNLDTNSRTRRDKWKTHRWKEREFDPDLCCKLSYRRSYCYNISLYQYHISSLC